jgi:REP element-mobilizing transposase RayT
MSAVKIWVHAVWCTKDSMSVLRDDIRKCLFQHIKENAREKRIYVDFVNGWLDHVHALLTLNSYMSISQIMQLIKRESAHWANSIDLVKSKLQWAREYFAASVSESQIEIVRKYIRAPLKISIL